MTLALDIHHRDRAPDYERCPDSYVNDVVNLDTLGSTIVMSRDVKALPTGTTIAGHYRLRFDIVDRFGKLTLRRAGRLHHLGIGTTHARTPALILTDETTTTVIDRTTG